MKRRSIESNQKHIHAVFAAAPLSRQDAERLIDGLENGDWLTQAFRGEPSLDRDALADLLEGLSRLAEERPDVMSVDLNPVIISDGRPVAVDALVEVPDECLGRVPPC